MIPLMCQNHDWMRFKLTENDETVFLIEIIWKYLNLNL